MTARRRERKRRPRRDWGRVFAVVVSAVFAVLGAVPLALGLLVRTEVVRSWAARETSALVARELSVAARYEVRVQAWPMLVALEDVVVEASDGGSPFLAVERVAVRPRLFSLLAGHLDAGDVEIIGPRIRVVVAGGELVNLRYKLPLSKGEGGEGGAPLASLAVTDARVDAVIEGVQVTARELDADVSMEPDGAFEIALRAGESTVTRVHPVPGRELTEDAVDEDVLCRLDARVRFQGPRLLVRRLQVGGSVDFDPDPGTRPSCKLGPGDWRNLEVSLGAVHVDLPAAAKDGGPAAPLRVGGRVHARVPAAIVHRFVKVPHVTGSVTLDLTGEYEHGGKIHLPALTGHVHAEHPGIDGKVFGAPVDLDLTTTADTVRVTKLTTLWGDGRLTAPEVVIEPFAPGVPLTSGPITFEGIELHSLLRDLGAHPRAHVAWTLEKGRFEYFKGHLAPPVLEGPLTVQTRGFEVYDRPVIDPTHVRMMGVREGTVRCTFGINAVDKAPAHMPGVVISNATIDTPRSHMDAAVIIAFADGIDIQVREGSRVDLGEIGPLGDIPISGIAKLRVGGRGKIDHPRLTGELKLSDFHFAGLPVGEIDSPNVAFEPLVLDLFEARIRHGQSMARASQVRLDFDAGATVVADAEIDTTEAPGLGVRDLFEVFHFDKDPRFTDLDAVASGRARVHYALGGREDRCGGGFLSVRTSMNLTRVALFGERYERGTVDADLVWDDQAAGSAGMSLDLHSATLQKGDGSVLIGATVRHGGVLRGNAVASGVPVARLDALGAYGKLFEGTASMVAEVGGTLGALTATADINVSRLRVGPATLGPSHLSVAMAVDPPPPPAPGGRTRGPALTACKNPRAAPFDQAAFDRDERDGDFVIDGALFDGQVALQKLRISRQRHKVLRGTVAARGLDLGTLANLVPGVAYAGASPRGALSATLDVKGLPFDAPSRADVALTLDSVDLERAGSRLRLLQKSSRVELGGDELRVPDLKVEVRSASGLAATVVAGGAVHRATTAPDVDLGVRVEPMDLGKLSADVPSVERAGGQLDASLRIQGPPSSLRYAGAASLRKGELALKGVPVALSDVDVDVEIGGGEARFRRATMRVGGGTVKVSGRVPLRGPEAGAFLANIDARGVKLPVADGVNLTADAHLEASYRPTVASGQRALPDVKGTVELTQFSYTRPISLNLSLAQLGRAPRTAVSSYDPDSDVVRFNVNLVSPRPLRFANNLVEMDLEVMSPGLVLSGTNQRFGARGLLRVLPDSKILIRSSEFLVREGFVRFDDPLKIAPKVDVRATTEYRRYASSSAEQPTTASGTGESGNPSATGTTSLTPASSTAGAGIWRISLQARGDTDNLKVTLSSDPALSQEDIVLLLTVGMTRAEMDRGAATALGESVGLEALSALTGADKAVKKIVPLIDEFRFGTGYSARTARTEPTVTVGKRITDSVRTSVTTGVSEDREVRSNIEWRLNRRMSVQGSYDNLNDISSSPVGNIGVDFRWRLEFE